MCEHEQQDECEAPSYSWRLDGQIRVNIVSRHPSIDVHRPRRGLQRDLQASKSVRVSSERRAVQLFGKWLPHVTTTYLFGVTATTLVTTTFTRGDRLWSLAPPHAHTGLLAVAGERKPLAHSPSDMRDDGGRGDSRPGLLTLLSLLLARQFEATVHRHPPEHPVDRRDSATRLCGVQALFQRPGTPRARVETVWACEVLLHCTAGWRGDGGATWQPLAVAHRMEASTEQLTSIGESGGIASGLLQRFRPLGASNCHLVDVAHVEVTIERRGDDRPGGSDGEDMRRAHRPDHRRDTPRA